MFRSKSLALGFSLLLKKTSIDCMLLSCHIRVSEWIHALQFAWMSRNSLLTAGVFEISGCGFESHCCHLRHWSFALKYKLFPNMSNYGTNYGLTVIFHNKLQSKFSANTEIYWNLQTSLQIFKSSFYSTENFKTYLLNFSSNMFEFVFYNTLQNLIFTTNEASTFSFPHFTKINSTLISHFSYTLRFYFVFQSRLNKGSFSYAKVSTFPQNIWFSIPQHILKQIK